MSCFFVQQRSAFDFNNKPSLPLLLPMKGLSLVFQHYRSATVNALACVSWARRQEGISRYTGSGGIVGQYVSGVSAPSTLINIA